MVAINILWIIVKICGKVWRCKRHRNRSKLDFSKENCQFLWITNWCINKYHQFIFCEPIIDSFFSYRIFCGYRICILTFSNMCTAFLTFTKSFFEKKLCRPKLLLRSARVWLPVVTKSVKNCELEDSSCFKCRGCLFL